MPRAANKSLPVRHQPLRYRRRKWFYDGRLSLDGKNLHITRVHGDIAGRASDLDNAIKAECRRLGATVHLDDRNAADELFRAMIPAVLP